MLTAGIEAPLEHVAADHMGAGQKTISIPLLGGTDVDENRPGLHCSQGFARS